MLYKKKIAFIALFSFLLLLINQYDSKAQGFENGNNISLSLLKDSLNLSPGQFGFNVLTITSFGATDMSFGGKAMLPQGWTLLKEFPNHIFVPAGQTVSIPIRIRSNAVSYGGVKYPIKLEIFDPQSDTSIAISTKIQAGKLNCLNPQSLSVTQKHYQISVLGLKIREIG